MALSPGNPGMPDDELRGGSHTGGSLEELLSSFNAEFEEMFAANARRAAEYKQKRKDAAMAFFAEIEAMKAAITRSYSYPPANSKAKSEDMEGHESRGPDLVTVRNKEGRKVRIKMKGLAKM